MTHIAGSVALLAGAPHPVSAQPRGRHWLRRRGLRDSPDATSAPHAGSWIGTNEFRLMPADAPHIAAATADVSTAVAGSLSTIAYTWSHADDGAQDGLLVLGRSSEPPGSSHSGVIPGTSNLSPRSWPASAGTDW